ncbi:FAD-dependent oxidoreductase [Pseudoalteromonas xiamenensis]|uniref:glycerol-3-phosphate dehydrogenase/oxidase n=1 Tax=Pseudoalteromonas xiamenensis TaxID=882626 RepID=UPI0035EE01EE
MEKVAIIGGGINGLCTAWKLAEAGFKVTLFERGELMQQTSAASSKLLHGGIRYLENFEFRLVREALEERKWWLENVPNLTRRLPILYPIYPHTRARWKMKIGMTLYDFLAGKKGIGRHRWLTPRQVKRCSPYLNQQNLKGAYLFHDGQMDDQALGLWVAERCRELGVSIHTQHPVNRITAHGTLSTFQGSFEFDTIINVAGPWSEQLLEDSHLPHDEHLDLVRGSHLLLPPISKFGHLLEVPGESRVVFVLPYKSQTLLGTTEVQHTLNETVEVSKGEQTYLLNLYNHYFTQPCYETDIRSKYAGVRPLLSGKDSLSKHSREYKITRNERLITVFGGKWTTARALGLAVLNQLRK